MAGTTLAEFIRDSSEQILAEWYDFARTCSPAADLLTPRELGDHARQMLDWIADDLETSQTKSEQEDKAKGLADGTPTQSAATKHGAIRFNDQFTLSQVFAEFRALRASVIGLWSRDRSITEHCELQELIRFNEAIDQAVAESVESFSTGIKQSRDIFTAILGHDLRNPLSAIMTGSMYLEKVLPADSDPRQVATSIHNSSLRMQTLINDLLDVSRKHLGGDLPISLVNVELEQVCKQVLGEIGLANPHVELPLLVDGDTSGRWDRDRMAQVVSNLVGNALQHGAKGNPITVSIVGKAGDVELSVHNWGPVIPTAAIHEIFEPTKRLSEGREDAKYKGSLGLGLYIVNLVVQSHAGTISVTSTTEEGTTFTAILPRTPPDKLADTFTNEAAIAN